MGRKYLYYPLAEISPHKIAIPGEFVFEDTLEPYDGPYVTAKGQFLSGTTITRDSRLLKESDGLIGAKFQTENSTEYYRLTEKEFQNHLEPRHYIFAPNSEDFKAGQTLRFFAQKINEPFRITEIDEEQFKSFNEENKEGIDSRLYNPITLDWVLSGKDAAQLNRKTIELTEVLYPGFERVRISPTEFVQIPPISEEKTYPDGKVISAKLPAAYGIPQKTNQACSNCKFAYNNYCSKWVAQIRKNYWCAAWKGIEDKKNMV